jgi:hypothetical protein
VKKIGFEIAILGTRGLDTNSPAQKYTLKSMPGKFNGLSLVCYQYVAFKMIAPAQDIGFELTKEYNMALLMFDEKTGGRSSLLSCGNKLLFDVGK